MLNFQGTVYIRNRITYSLPFKGGSILLVNPGSVLSINQQHQVRNTLKYVSDKDRKPFAVDLKTIYHAPNEQKAAEIRDKVTEKWSEKYPNAMKSWITNWDAITPIFKFSTEVRTVIYTTNAIESLNSTYRKLNRQRSVFPSDQALLKALYLATFEATRKWAMPIRNWGKVYGELLIMYEGRLPE